MKNILLLGATGSIGDSVLSVIKQNSDSLNLYGIAAGKNTEKAAAIIKNFSPKNIFIEDIAAYDLISSSFPNQNILNSDQELLDLISDNKVDIVVSAIVGFAGLKASLMAVNAGKIVLIANKESIVAAGDILMPLAKAKGAQIIPIDSEHNAIFQCLPADKSTTDVSKIIITASGGPFLDIPLSKLNNISPKDALKHPNWEMGRKITIDSATMMNKGLEIIEAHWLFNTPVEKIDVLMQRESIIHSMVEFIDGSFLAQMGLPDMRVPIAYCLGWPERLPLKIPRLDPVSLNALHFEAIDEQRFPCLPISLKASKHGGGAPAVLNGANEKVVAAFLNEEIRFVDISKILASVMQVFDDTLQRKKSDCFDIIPDFLLNILTLEDAVEADQWGREQAGEVLENLH